MNKEQYYNLGRKLTKEERKELFKVYEEEKDQEVREILIEEHLYIAEILSKKYAGRGIDYEDIYQVASMGLIFAIDRYDLSKCYVSS